jgi:hypothetical protein
VDGPGSLQAFRSQARAVLPLDGETAERCPWLWELLTRQTYAEGKPRLVAELAIVVGVGCWMVTVKCHGEALALTVSVPTLSELAVGLEAALTSPTVAWRPYETWKGTERASTKPKKK